MCSKQTLTPTVNPNSSQGYGTDVSDGGFLGVDIDLSRIFLVYGRENFRLVVQLAVKARDKSFFSDSHKLFSAKDAHNCYT